MELNKTLKNIAHAFALITTGALICTAIFCSIFYQEMQVGVHLLWEIIISSVLCSLLFLVFVSKKELSKRQMLIRQIIHFLLLNTILLIMAYQWNWISIDSIIQPIVFIALVAIVYIVVKALTFRFEKQMAMKMNIELEKYRDQSDN